jgi:hypothetical protein
MLAIPRRRRIGCSTVVAVVAFLVAAIAPAGATTAAPAGHPPDLTRHRAGAPDTDPPSDPIVRRSSGTARGYLLSKGRYTPVDAPKAGPETGTYHRDHRHQRPRLDGRRLQRLERHLPRLPPGRQQVYPDRAARRRGHAAVGHQQQRPDLGLLQRHRQPGPRLRTSQERGQAAGLSIDPDNVGHGFLWRRGVYTTIEVPGAVTTVPFAADNTGAVVGQYTDPDGSLHGSRLRGGVVTVLDPPVAAGAGTSATDTDDRGQVVGFYVGAGSG